jgi:hypothetical protein
LSRFDGEYKVRIMDDLGLWDQNLVRLVIRRSNQYSTAFLMENGTWMEFSEGTRPAENVGVLLPRAAIEAVVTGIEEWQGHTNHSDTEARVLREWLKSEKDRVDGFLTRGVQA